MGKKKYLIIIPIVIIIIGCLCLIFIYMNKPDYGILKEGVGFSSYEFNMKKMEPQSIEKVSDGYIMLSNINNNFDEVSNDIRITKYDKTFKRLWSYDYIHDERDYIVEETEKELNKYLITYTYKMIEKDDKLFFLIGIYSTSTSLDNTRLLILNRDGSIYDEHRYEESIDYMVSIDDDIITLAGPIYIYKYNYKTKKISKYEIKNLDEKTYKVLYKNNDEYLISSHIFYYTIGEEHIAEGTNSLYLLDKNFNKKKILDMDKLLGVKGVDVDYKDIKIFGERIYVSYFVHSNEDTNGYSGILVVDRNLNVIHNIKYTNEVIKEKIGESIDCEISDYNIYNDKLYILVGSILDQKILLSVYDENGKEIKSFKLKSLIPEEKIGAYSSYGYKIINYDEKELVYYTILLDDPVNSKKDIYKSILKFGRLEF